MHHPLKQVLESKGGPTVVQLKKESIVITNADIKVRILFILCCVQDW